MSYLKPDAFYDGVQYIEFDFLKNNNIQGILLDIDNTLIDMEKNMPEEVLKWVKDAKEHGFKVGILSNTNKKDKLVPISNKLGVEYVSFAKKPSKSGYIRGAKMLGLDSKNIAMVGDQVFTDVWGANRVGMFSIYVKPINLKEYWYTAWKRPIESLILKHYGY